MFLEAVPTIVIVLLFYFFLRWAFFTPIQKAMADREALIEGARAEAAQAESAAKQELDAYGDALKKARAEIFAEQEAARQIVLDERATIAESNADAGAGGSAEGEGADRAPILPRRALEIDRDTPALAGDIARVVLQRPSPLRGGAAQ